MKTSYFYRFLNRIVCSFVFYHYLGHSNDYLLLSLKCSFIFSGVYVDSTQEIPFSIENKGKSYAKVAIDLSEHDDFTLHFQPGIS